MKSLNYGAKIAFVLAFIFGMAAGPTIFLDKANAQPENCRDTWGIYYCDGYILGEYDCDQKYSYRDNDNSYKEAWNDNSYKEQWWNGYKKGWSDSGCNNSGGSGGNDNSGGSGGNDNSGGSGGNGY